MPQDHSTPKPPERVYSIHVKPEYAHRVTETGQASTDLGDLALLMWGKNSAWYVLDIDGIEYDLETNDEDMKERMHRIADLHRAFYDDK